MRLAVAAVLAASLVAVAPAGAAEKPSRKQQLAVQLSRIALPEANWDQMIANAKEQVRASVEQSLQASGQTLPARLRKVIDGELEGLFDAIMYTYPEMVDLQAGLLVKHYTEAELDQLVAFYRTPVGQKSIQVMPAVMQDAMGAFQARAQERMPAQLQALTKKLEAEAAAMKAEAEAGAKPSKP
jgi:uncharacterized protein